MITWMQTLLMKNGRWIFSILLIIIVVAFVFTINQAGGMGTPRDHLGKQEFLGVNLASAREMRNLEAEIVLSRWLTTGREPNQRLSAAEQFQRIALRHLADQLHLPGPTDAQRTEFIRSRPLFRGPDGRFSASAYQSFLDRLQTIPALSESLLAHVLDEDFRLEKAQELLGGPGYVLEEEVRRAVVDGRTRRTILVATLPWADFNPEIEVTEAALQAFYDTRPSSWGLPERVEADLIRFRADAFAERVQAPSEEALQQYFARNQWRFRSLREPAEGEAPAEPTLDEHRAEVERLVREEQARSLALAAADAFAMRIYRDKLTTEGDALDRAVAEAAGQRIELAPYARGEMPAGLTAPLTQTALQQLFELPSNRIFSDLVQLPDGGGILIRKSLVPARVRPLAEVREQVEADYRAEERRRRFDEYGRGVREQLLAAIASGQDFRSAAEAAGLSVVEHAAVTADEPNEAIEPAVLLAVARLEAGEITPLVIPSEGASGKLAFLAAVEKPAASELADEVAAMRAQYVSAMKYFSSQGLLESLIEANAAHLSAVGLD